MSERAPVDRLPLFAPPSAPAAAEVKEARSVLDELGERRREYLEAIRSCMRRLYRSKVALHGKHGASVTPDDARRAFEQMSPPRDMSRNFLGQVFRERGWVVVGEYVSGTERGHGNKLNRYAWEGAE